CARSVCLRVLALGIEGSGPRRHLYLLAASLALSATLPTFSRLAIFVTIAFLSAALRAFLTLFALLRVARSRLLLSASRRCRRRSRWRVRRAGAVGPTADPDDPT